MEFELNINLDNDAYVMNLEDELIRNLKKVIKSLESGWVYGHVMDTNGNSTGEWEIKV